MVYWCRLISFPNKIIESWGSWGGAGVVPGRYRRQCTPARPGARTRAALHHVIPIDHWFCAHVCDNGDKRSVRVFNISILQCFDVIKAESICFVFCKLIGGLCKNKSI